MVSLQWLPGGGEAEEEEKGKGAIREGAKRQRTHGHQRGSSSGLQEASKQEPGQDIGEPSGECPSKEGQEAKACSRVLQPNLSLVSVDSDGYPKMLSVPHPMAFPKTALMKAAMEQDVLCGTCKGTEPQKQVRKKPAASKQQKKKGRRQVELSRPGSSQGPVVGKEKKQQQAQGYRCTFATEQSYIHFGKQFLVATSKQQAARKGRTHKELMKVLASSLAEEGVVEKARAVAMRDALIKP